jgi:hypothetical protein
MYGMRARLARVYVSFVKTETPILEQPLDSSANIIPLALLHIAVYTSY